MNTLDHQLVEVLFGPVSDHEAGIRAWIRDAEGQLPGSLGELTNGIVGLRSVMPEWQRYFGNGDGVPPPEFYAEMSALALDGAEHHGFKITEDVNAKILAIDSPMAQIARMTMRGEANVFWMHDYASGPLQAMWEGGIGNTTNPPLINIVRQKNPVYWGGIRDQIRAKEPSIPVDKMAEEITIQAVVENAMLFRPIWKLSGGKVGYVSMQLAPTNATDPEAMLKQATEVWEKLGAIFGGTPNVVFKIPGTKAGLAAVPGIASQGIGLNITVNFSVSQHVAFAKAIKEYSTAPVNFLTFMDGRLDDRVSEQLMDNTSLPEAKAKEVATWATTICRQRIFDLLYSADMGGMGIRDSIHHLPAAGRGAHNIERSMQNGHGIPATVLTVFPDRQKEFNSEPRIIDPEGMWAKIPDFYVDILSKSEIFRQASEPDGLKTERFDLFVPTLHTLCEFVGKYADFLVWCAATS